MSRPRPLRFPFYCSRPPRDLHSFPTRRSSDLQYSFSTDPKLRGAPAHHVVNIREVRLAAGAEFVIMICGDIMTMPGLPKVPAANSIDVGADGRITGLF